MDTVQKFAAKQVLESQLKNITSSGNSNMPSINWEDYNYPSFFKIIHYEPSEIPENKAPLINVQLRQLKIVFIICIINLVNNILEVALWKNKNDKIPATRIVASIFNFIIFLPLLLALFYRLLLTLLKDNSYFNIYKYMQITFIVIYVVVSIVPWSPFNGFVHFIYISKVQAAKDFKQGGTVFSGLLSILESLMYILVAFIAIVNYVKVNRYINQGEESLISNANNNA